MWLLLWLQPLPSSCVIIHTPFFKMRCFSPTTAFLFLWHISLGISPDLPGFWSGCLLPITTFHSPAHQLWWVDLNSSSSESQALSAPSQHHTSCADPTAAGRWVWDVSRQEESPHHLAALSVPALSTESSSRCWREASCVPVYCPAIVPHPATVHHWKGSVTCLWTPTLG